MAVNVYTTGSVIAEAQIGGGVNADASGVMGPLALDCGILRTTNQNLNK